jgi:hypothetical protein
VGVAVVEPAVEAVLVLGARVPDVPVLAVGQMGVQMAAPAADQVAAPMAVRVDAQMIVPAVAQVAIGRVATTGTSRTDHR